MRVLPRLRRHFSRFGLALATRPALWLLCGTQFDCHFPIASGLHAPAREASAVDVLSKLRSLSYKGSAAVAAAPLLKGGTMGFGQAVSSAFTNYFNFSTRATRPEYWYFVLFLLIAGIVTAI